MSNLVERLRRMLDMTTTGNDLADIGRAADEIERLLDEAAINETIIHGLRANRDDAEAEIERLRLQVNALQGDLKDEEVRFERLREEVRILREQLAGARQTIRELTK